MAGARVILLATALGLAAAPSSAFGLAQFGAASLDADPDMTLVSPVTSDCSAVTLTQRGGRAPGAPIDGVVTRWRVRTAGAVTAMTFQVVRRSSPGAYRVVASDTQAIAAGGVSEFTSRIPIGAGDRIGLHGTSGAVPFHSSPVGDTVDVFDPPLGDTTQGATRSDAGEMLAQADVEPDADGDHFGDETQDLCPTGAATQLQCSGTLLGPDVSGDPGRWGTVFSNGTGQLATEANVTGTDATVAQTDGVLVRWRVRALSGVFMPRIIRPNGSDYQAILSGAPAQLN
jgi:hypothetical protein